MKLEVDAGNTAIKWRDRDSGRSGVFTQASGWPRGLSFPAESIAVCSVAGDEDNRWLHKHCVSRLDCIPRFVQVTREDGGVINSYQQPEAMGADRWSALIAAHHRVQGPVLLADLGSALTLEFLAGDGAHLGGYIIPGRRLMQASLTAGTGRVRFGDSPDFEDGPGDSTATCVRNGVWLALAGALDRAGDLAREKFGDYRLVVTGGDGGPLLEAAGSPAHGEYVPDLVLDGLTHIRHFEELSI